MGLLTKPRTTDSVASAVMAAAKEFLLSNEREMARIEQTDRWRACLGAVIFGSLGNDEDLRQLVAPLGTSKVAFSVRELTGAYPSLLNYTVNHGNVIPCPTERKRQGSYYTPPRLASRLAEIVASGAGEVLDPACGVGALLLAAGEHLGKNRVSSLHGVDTDPIAVLLCRHSLREWAGLQPDHPLPNIKVANALTHSWTEEDRFDAIVANPPFGNVVEGMVPDEAKRIRGVSFPELGGTADYAYYFSSLAVRLLRPGGRAALIQPRAFVSANSTRALREERVHGAELASVEEYFEPDMFDGAAVYVCIATFENRLGHPGLPFDPIAEKKSPFELTASMTVAQAYQIREHVAEGGPGLRLVTTGLIDPHQCLWGERSCRYLKSDYIQPTLRHDAPIQGRIERARRPKLLVAGLSSQLEAFLDEEGSYIGAVSTYTVTHTRDEVPELKRLLAYLLSPEASLAFRQQLGASAMGGGNITVTKAFLSSLLSRAS